MVEIKTSGVGQSHHNAFGALRIIFAFLVLLDHCSQLLYKDDYAEILYILTNHKKSFGQLAVDGFFIISGFLITKSYINSAGLYDYIYKRFLRIYPGFVISFLICVFVFGPIFGGKISTLSILDYLKIVSRLVRLEPPFLQDSFSDIGGYSLNGSLWSIAYEARCYVLLPVFAWLGLLKHRVGLLAVTSALVLATLPAISVHLASIPILIPDMQAFVLCTAMFSVGACAFLWKDFLSLRGDIAFVCAIVFAASLFGDTSGALILPWVFAYVIFYIALHPPFAFLTKINNKNDLSYGVYIYAWPITLSFIALIHGIRLPVLMSMTAGATVIAASASWFLVEKPALKLKRYRPDRLQMAAGIASKDSAVQP